MVNTRFNAIRPVAPVNAPAEESAPRGRGPGRGRGHGRVAPAGNGAPFENAPMNENPSTHDEEIVENVEDMGQEEECFLLFKQLKLPLIPLLLALRPRRVKRERFREANTGSQANSVLYATPSHNVIQDSQGVAPSADSRPSFDRTCYNCGEPGHMRRDCSHPLVLDSAQQQSKAVDKNVTTYASRQLKVNEWNYPTLDLELAAEPIPILDRDVRGLRTKEIKPVKVQWKHLPDKEATWEAERDMQDKYSQLFVNSGKEVSHQDDRAQFYAFPGKSEAEVSDAVIAVSEFKEVFPTDLPSIPADRDKFLH
ncbi:uncharacterized protein LOC125856420 [Solanum stenotomum]|uniref:uncharacterized protein LOC125856420 n=1 Tax=Solanum stenotomum TaxID=172797 RepID=UPI0020D1E926|nr:uncharacterized protein LOC125856420 [Solanum stenotomum]